MSSSSGSDDIDPDARQIDTSYTLSTLTRYRDEKARLRSEVPLIAQLNILYNRCFFAYGPLPIVSLNLSDGQTYGNFFLPPPGIIPHSNPLASVLDSTEYRQDAINQRCQRLITSGLIPTSDKPLPSYINFSYYETRPKDRDDHEEDWFKEIIDGTGVYTSDEFIDADVIEKLLLDKLEEAKNGPQAGKFAYIDTDFFQCIQNDFFDEDAKAPAKTKDGEEPIDPRFRDTPAFDDESDSTLKNFREFATKWGFFDDSQLPTVLTKSVTHPKTGEVSEVPKTEADLAAEVNGDGGSMWPRFLIHAFNKSRVHWLALLVDTVEKNIYIFDSQPDSKDPGAMEDVVRPFLTILEKLSAWVGRHFQGGNSMVNCSTLDFDDYRSNVIVRPVVQQGPTSNTCALWTVRNIEKILDRLMKTDAELLDKDGKFDLKEDYTINEWKKLGNDEMRLHFGKLYKGVVDRRAISKYLTSGPSADLAALLTHLTTTLQTNSLLQPILDSLKFHRGEGDPTGDSSGVILALDADCQSPEIFRIGPFEKVMFYSTLDGMNSVGGQGGNRRGIPLPGNNGGPMWTKLHMVLDVDSLGRGEYRSTNPLLNVEEYVWITDDIASLCAQRGYLDPSSPHVAEIFQFLLGRHPETPKFMFFSDEGGNTYLFCGNMRSDANKRYTGAFTVNGQAIPSNTSIVGPLGDFAHIQFGYKNEPTGPNAQNRLIARKTANFLWFRGRGYALRDWTSWMTRVHNGSVTKENMEASFLEVRDIVKKAKELKVDEKVLLQVMGNQRKEAGLKLAPAPADGEGSSPAKKTPETSSSPNDTSSSPEPGPALSDNGIGDDTVGDMSLFNEKPGEESEEDLKGDSKEVLKEVSKEISKEVSKKVSKEVSKEDSKEDPKKEKKRPPTPISDIDEDFELTQEEEAMYLPDQQKEKSPLKLLLPRKDLMPPGEKEKKQKEKTKSPEKKDSPKKDSPKKDSPKKDSPKKDSPKKDSPKKDSPKKDSPKKASPKKKKKRVDADEYRPDDDDGSDSDDSDKDHSSDSGDEYLDSTTKKKKGNKDKDANKDRPPSPEIIYEPWGPLVNGIGITIPVTEACVPAQIFLAISSFLIQPNDFHRAGHVHHHHAPTHDLQRYRLMLENRAEFLPEKNKNIKEGNMAEVQLLELELIQELRRQLEYVGNPLTARELPDELQALEEADELVFLRFWGNAMAVTCSHGGCPRSLGLEKSYECCDQSCPMRFFDCPPNCTLHFEDGATGETREKFTTKAALEMNLRIIDAFYELVKGVVGDRDVLRSETMRVLRIIDQGGLPPTWWAPVRLHSEMDVTRDLLVEGMKRIQKWISLPPVSQSAIKDWPRAVHAQVKENLNRILAANRLRFCRNHPLMSDGYYHNPGNGPDSDPEDSQGGKKDKENDKQKDKDDSSKDGKSDKSDKSGKDKNNDKDDSSKDKNLDKSDKSGKGDRSGKSDKSKKGKKVKKAKKDKPAAEDDTEVTTKHARKRKADEEPAPITISETKKRKVSDEPPKKVVKTKKKKAETLAEKPRKRKANWRDEADEVEVARHGEEELKEDGMAGDYVPLSSEDDDEEERAELLWENDALETFSESSSESETVDEEAESLLKKIAEQSFNESALEALSSSEPDSSSSSSDSDSDTESDLKTVSSYDSYDSLDFFLVTPTNSPPAPTPSPASSRSNSPFPSPSTPPSALLLRRQRSLSPLDLTRSSPSAYPTTKCRAKRPNAEKPFSANLTRATSLQKMEDGKETYVFSPLPTLPSSSPLLTHPPTEKDTAPLLPPFDFTDAGYTPFHRLPTRLPPYRLPKQGKKRRYTDTDLASPGKKEETPARKRMSLPARMTPVGEKVREGVGRLLESVKRGKEVVEREVERWEEWGVGVLFGEEKVEG